jgi:hypothetical protein
MVKLISSRFLYEATTLLWSRFSVSQFASLGPGAVCGSGTGVPPVNHAQDARATFKLQQYPSLTVLLSELNLPFL